MVVQNDIFSIKCQKKGRRWPVDRRGRIKRPKVGRKWQEGKVQMFIWANSLKAAIVPIKKPFLKVPKSKPFLPFPRAFFFLLSYEAEVFSIVPHHWTWGWRPLTNSGPSSPQWVCSTIWEINQPPFWFNKATPWY